MTKRELSKVAAEMGRKGARQYRKFLRNLPPEQLSERMRRMANARWHPQPAAKPATETATS
jgi:hypothetical protein